MENKNELFGNILEEIKNNENLTKKLVVYLEKNGLIQDLYSKLYYIIEKSSPIYKIKYYKSKINGKLLSMNDVKNSYELLKANLEDYIVYVYEEIKTLYFKSEEVGKESVRRQVYSKSYGYPFIANDVLSKDNNYENVNWVNILNQNPLLFTRIILEYNIDLDKLKEIDIKSYTYKKEIKKN